MEKEISNWNTRQVTTLSKDQVGYWHATYVWEKFFVLLVTQSSAPRLNSLFVWKQNPVRLDQIRVVKNNRWIIFTEKNRNPQNRNDYISARKPHPRYIPSRVSWAGVYQQWLLSQNPQGAHKSPRIKVKKITNNIYTVLQLQFFKYRVHQ